MWNRVTAGVRMLQYADRLPRVTSLALTHLRRQGPSSRPIYPSSLEVSNGHTSLAELAERHGSDKGPSKHRYTELYELLFGNLRDRALTFLEMGLQLGGPEHGFAEDRATTGVPSIEMWLAYFPRAKIYGLDVSDFSAHERDRFEFIRCDMDKLEEIDAAAARLPELDIVIDDASHASHHQQQAFLRLFPKLRSGGLYIIEDLRWQPELYEKPGFTKTADFFQWYLSFGSFSHAEPEMAEAFDALRTSFSGCFIFKEGYRSHGKDQVLVVHKR